MRLKRGVKLTDLCPQMVLASIIVDTIFESHGVDSVITSANDSKHGPNSWHYRGRALDYRTKFPELNGKEQTIRDEIAEALGDEFDVVLEDVGGDNEHVHVEYDP